MTQAARKLSFEEYARLDAEDWVRLGLPEGRCEYWEGELVELMTEGQWNDWIADYLFYLLLQAKVTQPNLIRPGRCEVEVAGRPRTRFPDLVILREEHLALTQRRLLITRAMPSPRLVVEVVSPGKKNRERDYIAKRQQYAERGIPEYWLIDPERQSITVLALVEQQYKEHGVFQGSDRVASPLLGLLPVTAEQVLQAGG